LQDSVVEDGSGHGNDYGWPVHDLVDCRAVAIVIIALVLANR
jgi:hypothetical protein